MGCVWDMLQNSDLAYCLLVIAIICCGIYLAYYIHKLKKRISELEDAGKKLMQIISDRNVVINKSVAELRVVLNNVNKMIDLTKGEYGHENPRTNRREN